jgi:phosphoenolpyruvate carboxylase
VQVAGHEDILQGNPTLKQRLRLREPYVTALNVQQALVLKKMRDQSTQFCALQNGSEVKSPKRAAELVELNPTTEFPPGLEDTLILTMKGIAAGIQNTG